MRVDREAEGWCRGPRWRRDARGKDRVRRERVGVLHAWSKEARCRDGRSGNGHEQTRIERVRALRRGSSAGGLWDYGCGQRAERTWGYSGVSNVACS